MVNEERVSLKNVEIFHMDECLDWQGRLLAENDPYNFKTFMLAHFYAPIDPELAVLEENRNFLNPHTMEAVAEKIVSAPSITRLAAGDRTAISPTTRRGGTPSPTSASNS